MTANSGTGDHEYVLGTASREVDRLYEQHRAWRPFAFDAWRRAGFHPGQTIVDLGCGPGAATMDLADLVGPQGHIIAVDRSRAFLDVLEQRAAQRGLRNILTACADIVGWAPETTVDGVWCRWALSFAADPLSITSAMATWSRPDARFVFHEYYDYGSWRMHPALPELEEFVHLVIRSWRDAGGEPDLGLALPRLLHDSGLRVVERRPICQILVPADHGWTWLAGFVKSGLTRLQELGYLSEVRTEQIARAFREAESRPGVQMVAPSLVETIAEHRVRSS